MIGESSPVIGGGVGTAAAGGPVRVAVGEGPFRILGEAVRLGDDVLAWVVGGTRAHVGAVAVAALRPSLADPTELSYTPSLITLPGHKEDALALEGVGVLSRMTRHNVVLTVGIHIDSAGGGDIAALISNARAVIKELADQIVRRDRQGGTRHVSPH